MPSAVDKVVVANRSGMVAKYTKAGVTRIDKALKRLIAADKARGLATQVIEIDDKQQMTAVGGQAIVNAGDQRGCKQAVDTIYKKLNPDYIVLLDGPDVVPHIALSRIAGLTDDDATIDSDLPYACAAAFSRQAKAYLAVTRVVGRIPMPAGSKDATALVSLVDACAKQKPKPASRFASYFGVSAKVWSQSTQLSLSALFGNNQALHLSPTAGHPGINASLKRLVHFINCHGASGDPQFYGQSGQSFPVAMESTKVAPNISAGAVAAAECCYGAQLYDNGLLGNAQPMSMSYMLEGAAAFLGSTTIAYGPAASNGQADLLAQYFLEAVLGGASSGRALLQARQRFVQSQQMASAANLKTLAQFLLLGDPSLVAVTVPKTPLGKQLTASANSAAAVEDEASGRKARRADLKSIGLAVAAAASVMGRRARNGSSAVKRVRAIAKERGFSRAPEVFTVTGGPQYRSAAKALDREPKVVVVSEKRPAKKEAHASFHVLVAYILGEGIASIEECRSR